MLERDRAFAALRIQLDGIAKIVRHYPAGAPGGKGGQFMPGDGSDSGGDGGDVAPLAVDPEAVPPVPNFITSNKAQKAENEALGEKMRQMALAGDLKGLNGMISIQSPKLIEYRNTLRDLLHAAAKPPEVFHEPGAAGDWVNQDSVAQAEKALAAFGITTSEGKNGHFDSEFLTILNAAGAESARLNARWPGITNGIVIRREKPGAGCLGVNGLDNTIGIVTPAKHTSHSKPVAPGETPYSISTTEGGWTSTFRHELGHALDYGSMEVHRWELKATKFEIDGKTVDTPTWASKNVSKYAGTNTSEALAEMFSLYTAPNYKPGRLPKAVEANMEKLASRKWKISPTWNKATKWNKTPPPGWSAPT